MRVAGPFLVDGSGAVRAAFSFRRVPEHWSAAALQPRVARFQVRVEDSAGVAAHHSDSARLLVR